MASLHPAAEGLHVALFALGVLSLLLRFYSRAFVLKRWGLDDTIAVGILVSNLQFGDDKADDCGRFYTLRSRLHISLC